MKIIKCKFCGKEDNGNMQGYCQRCYKYFIIDKKEVYDTPPYGEIWYAPNGDCICPFCGKAFRKLGIHFYYSHKLTSREAHKKHGWDLNAKATNEDYRNKMRNVLQYKCVKINLLEKGKATRFQPGHRGRPRSMVSAMTMNRIRRYNIKKGGANKNESA